MKRLFILTCLVMFSMGLKSQDLGTEPLWNSDLLTNYSPEKELIDKRDQFQKHFSNDDGSISAVVTAGSSLNYKDESGSWQTVDSRIVLNTSGNFQEYKYANLKNNFKTFYSDNSHGAALIEIDGKTITDGLNKKMLWLDADMNILQTVDVNDSKADLSNASNQIVYNDIFPEVDLRYSQFSDTRKMDYIIQSRDVVLSAPEGAAFLAFSEDVALPRGWKMNIEKDELLSTCNSIKIYNSDKELKAIFNIPEYIDAENNLLQYSYKIDQNSVYSLIPIHWLKSEERLYPIIIDPTITISNSTSGTSGYCNGSTKGTNYISSGRLSGGNYIDGWAKIPTSFQGCEIFSSVKITFTPYAVQGYSTNNDLVTKGQIAGKSGASVTDPVTTGCGSLLTAVGAYNASIQYSIKPNNCTTPITHTIDETNFANYIYYGYLAPIWYHNLNSYNGGTTDNLGRYVQIRPNGHANAPYLTVVYTIPTPTFSSISSSVCVGDVYSLPTTSDNSLSGTWAPSTVNTSSAGTTTYTFTPGCGNTYSTQVSVIEANVTAAASSTSIIVGNTVTLTAAGASTYTWAAAGAGSGLTSSSTTNPLTIIPTAPGIYTYTVTGINASGCAETAEVTVSVISASIPLNGDFTTCVGSTETYSTTSGKSNYVWNVVGGTIVSGGSSSDYTATINWTTAGSGSITVGYGGSTQVYNISVSSVNNQNLSQTIYNDEVPYIIEGQSLYTSGNYAIPVQGDLCDTIFLNLTVSDCATPPGNTGKIKFYSNNFDGAEVTAGFIPEYGFDSYGSDEFYTNDRMWQYYDGYTYYANIWTIGTSTYGIDNFGMGFTGVNGTAVRPLGLPGEHFEFYENVNVSGVGSMTKYNTLGLRDVSIQFDARIGSTSTNTYMTLAVDTTALGAPSTFKRIGYGGPYSDGSFYNTNGIATYIVDYEEYTNNRAHFNFGFVARHPGTTQGGANMCVDNIILSACPYEGVIVSTKTDAGEDYVWSKTGNETTVLSIDSTHAEALYQWEYSTVGCEGPFSEITCATNNSYTTPANLSEPTWYRCKVWYSNDACPGVYQDQCFLVNISCECPTVEITNTQTNICGEMALTATITPNAASTCTNWEYAWFRGDDLLNSWTSTFPYNTVIDPAIGGTYYIKARCQDDNSCATSDGKTFTIGSDDFTQSGANLATGASLINVTVSNEGAQIVSGDASSSTDITSSGWSGSMAYFCEGSYTTNPLKIILYGPNQYGYSSSENAQFSKTVDLTGKTAISVSVHSESYATYETPPEWYFQLIVGNTVIATQTLPRSTGYNTKTFTGTITGNVPAANQTTGQTVILKIGFTGDYAHFVLNSNSTFVTFSDIITSQSSPTSGTITSQTIDMSSLCKTYTCLRFEATQTFPATGGSIIYNVLDATTNTVLGTATVSSGGTTAFQIDPFSATSVKLQAIISKNSSSDDSPVVTSWSLVDCVNDPLPVTYLNYGAECNDNEIVVSWSTASETNADYFVVEKLINSDIFTTIANLSANGTTNQVHDYYVIDENSRSATNFYRIKQVDFDGTEDYTNIFGTICEENGLEYFNAFYDDNNVVVDFSISKNQEYILYMLDISGRAVCEKRIISNDDKTQRILIPNNGFSAGVYTVKLQSATSVNHKKIMLP